VGEQSEILDAMTDVNNGDILTFFGAQRHARRSRDGNGVHRRIAGAGWLGDQVHPWE